MESLLSAVKEISSVYQEKGFGSVADTAKAEALLARFIEQNWDSRAAVDTVRCPQWDYYVITIMDVFYTL